MRAVLFHGGERQDGDPACFVNAGGEILRGHFSPVALGKHRHSRSRQSIFARLLSWKITEDETMNFAGLLRALTVVAVTAAPAAAQTLDKVTFATNWVA